MARNAATVDYSQDYYRRFAKIYFDKILETLIEFGDLKKETGLILDFGCGFRYLKKKLRNNNVIGYDIIPELSDIADYHNLRQDKIVLNNVLGHLYPEKIKNLLIEFRKMNRQAVLLVCLPIENWISRIMVRV